MIEHIYDALAASLYYDWPKNADGKPVVYNRVVKIWNQGDRDIKAVSVPSITFQGESSDPEEIASGLWEITHNINIEVQNQGTDPKSSERDTNEASRLLFEFLKDRRRMWVLTVCPICFKSIMSPGHYLDEHGDIFGDYATAAVTQFETDWTATHDSNVPIPYGQLTLSGVSTEAFYRVYEAVRNQQAVTNLPDKAKKAIEVALATRMRPIRLLSQAKLSGTSSEGSKGKELLASGKWKWTAKENIFQAAYGPDDNTPTTAWKGK